LFHHRTAPLIVALSGLLLAACDSGSPAQPDTGRQVVLDRLAEAEDAPCSAALDAVTTSGGTRLQHMAGRINLNAPLTGRTTEKTQQYREDVVITREKVYRRPTGSHGAWQEFPASAAKGGIPVDRLPQYARLLLRRGGSVHRSGELVRVSARVVPDDVASVDRVSGRNLKGATAIDADVWIDQDGRVVRVRQDIHLASGPDVTGTLTLSDFKSPIAVGTPAAK
jgi:hypothetical protein